MSTIRVDYANARAQAKKLQATASDYEDIVRNLKASLEQVPHYWEGGAADAFSIAIRQRINEIQQIGNNATTLAQQIRRVVDELEETEQRLKAQMEAQLRMQTFGNKSSNR